MNRARALLPVALVLCVPALALAGDAPAAAGPTPHAVPATDLAAAARVPVPGSSDDVNYEIESARPRPAGILRHGPVSLLDPVIDDLNARLRKDLDLEIGLAYTSVWQRATDGDIRDAAGGDIDLFARWALFGGRECENRGVLGVYGEYRHDVGNHAPRDLGDSFGSLWPTTNNFGVQDPELVQCWWEQHFADDAAVVTFGKTDPTNFYNTHRFQNDATAFLSRSFASNPGRAFPSNGLGANLKVKLDEGWYATGGFQDANGDKAKSGFHTIDEHEYFTAAEVGWTPTIEGWGKGAYRLTLWHIDERDDAAIDSDEGVALSCDQEIGGGIVPFFRAAWSEGDASGVERFLCGGVGLEGVLRGKEDLTGIGIAWGDPSDGDLDGQWGGEVFHRFQLAPDVQLTVGYQYVLSPSFESVAGDDPVGTFEVRIRISF